ncbi:MAG TPA: ribbon-helix-helix protein, CopG family [Hyphomicrobiaceae bacterium]|nr:ribbon-helix-helix protein, CopG family [Hyphomicrobiaceae bacterium]
MTRETLAFRIDPEKKQALDELAQLLDRDRSFLINEAIEQYLDVNAWQVDLIERRLAEADSGAPGVPHEEVFTHLHRRISKSPPTRRSKSDKVVKR